MEREIRYYIKSSKAGSWSENLTIDEVLTRVKGILEARSKGMEAGRIIIEAKVQSGRWE